MVSIQHLLLFILTTLTQISGSITRFNTTLVIVHQGISEKYIKAMARFNTTLVIVHLKIFRKLAEIFPVSIQHLLLFIMKELQKGDIPFLRFNTTLVIVHLYYATC